MQNSTINEYLPLITHIVEKLQLDVNVPRAGYANVEGSKEMGRLLNSIRSGETRAPQEFMEYILAKGFDLNRADAEHERKWLRNTEVIMLRIEITFSTPHTVGAESGS